MPITYYECRIKLVICCLLALLSGWQPAAWGTGLHPGQTVYAGLQSMHAEEAGHPFQNSRYVIIDGVELHFRFWPVAAGNYRGSCLLLHGFSGSTYSWEKVAGQMQSMGFEVVAVDIPPFGFSDKSPRVNQGITPRARLMHQLLEQIFPGRTWHVAGHSMGGAVAQGMALMYPESLQSVTFVAGALFSQVRVEGTLQTGDPSLLHKPDSATHAPSQATSVDFSRGAGILTAWPVRNIAGRLAGTFFITPKRVRGLLESAYGEPPNREQVEAYMAPLKTRGTATAILAGRRNSTEIASLHAADLNVPALAVWGSEDTWVPMESRRHVIGMMPGIRTFIIEGAGHNPMETHSEVFLDQWTGFIRSHSGF